MNSHKFKVGDRVVIYGKVKGIVTALPWKEYYQVAYDKKMSHAPDYGSYKENALEHVEIFESPLYQVMREDNDE